MPSVDEHFIEKFVCERWDRAGDSPLTTEDKANETRPVRPGGHHHIRHHHIRHHQIRHQTSDIITSDITKSDISTIRIF